MKFSHIAIMAGIQLAHSDAFVAQPEIQASASEIKTLRQEVNLLQAKAATETRLARKREQGGVGESDASAAARILTIEELHAKQRRLRELSQQSEAALKEPDLTRLKIRLAAASEAEKRAILDQQRAIDQALPKR